MQERVGKPEWPESEAKAGQIAPSPLRRYSSRKPTLMAPSWASAEPLPPATMTSPCPETQVHELCRSTRQGLPRAGVCQAQATREAQDALTWLGMGV